MQTKICTKCNIQKNISEFAKQLRCQYGVRPDCKKCQSIYHKNYRIKHKNKLSEAQKKWRKENILRVKQSRKTLRIKCPWYNSYHNAKARCHNPNHPKYPRYGGRGIKSLITQDEIKKLWYRDKAYLLKQPSIDRKDNDGNYTFNNCQFIEMMLNSIKDRNKIILQFDLEDNFIQEFKNQVEAELKTGISKCTINSCLKKKTKSAGRFRWEYKIK